jgi:uncharacterized membrane protein YhhN
VLPWALLTAVATVALLFFERAHARAGIWIAKPLAATGFVGAAMSRNALDTAYGTWILAGLVLSFWGDVLLIPRGAPGAFLAGIVCFLLAHVAYLLAFALRGLDVATVGVAGVAVLAASLLGLRHLLPHVPIRMRRPVLLYGVVISVMLVCAAGTVGRNGGVALFVGALSFYVSDLAVARERFVQGSFTNKLWGLPLYFAAQLLLASTIGR